MPADSIPNVNCLWGEVVAGTLARLGLRHAVISPGSRSAPLVWGFTRQKEIECVPVLDERSAAFYALGLAKAADRPVALICTSGTAAANFLPAVIEASLSGAPLLVLTADRPPELRDCHAGQAIDQIKLYGHYPRWQHELALPENQPELLRYLRQTMMHAWRRAWQPWPGPVHLNFPFREPLAPVAESGFKPPAKKFFQDFYEVADAFAGSEFKIASSSDEAQPIGKAKNVLVVAGPHARCATAVCELINSRRWPVLADATSAYRHDTPAGRGIVAHYDLILRSEKWRRRLAPDVVLQIGHLPTSKVLRSWLRDLPAPVLILDRSPDNLDPLHRNARVWQIAGDTLGELDKKRKKPGSTYAKRWRKLEQAAAQAVNHALGEISWSFEGKTAWLLSQKLPAGTPVFAASSMPVRDCEFFWEAGRGQKLCCNRGANGIDGTASTALGVAHAELASSVLLTGDLALLHDQNGLLAARELPKGASLAIVCINNDGGGIFEYLPIAQFDPPFERFFATPQRADFEKFAALYGLDFHRAATWAEFERALLPLPKSGVRLIEVRTDRKRDAAFRKKLLREIARELERVKV